MKRGVGKVRHVDGTLLWIQSRKKDFKMVQVPTNSNMAEINAKPLGGQSAKMLSIGGPAANGYRSIHERRQYPMWIGRSEEIQ